MITSNAETIVEEPNSLTASLMRLRLEKAAVFIETLSAPEDNRLEISSKDLIPPPTVIGIKTSLTVFSINSSRVFLPYKLATVSW